MSTLASINPQVHCHAVAYWENGVLVEAGIYSEVEVRRADYLIIETPQAYTLRQQKGDQQDLIDLAFSAGRVAAKFRNVTRTLPAAWKGQVPKPKRRSDGPYIIEHRAFKRLSAEEITVVKVPQDWKLCCDVWDAVALGLWKLGRK